MTKKDWFGIGYVSIWVIIWGTIGSLVDLPFLNAEIYSAGSLGQLATFLITALFSIVAAVWLYPKILANELVARILDIEANSK